MRSALVLVALGNVLISQPAATQDVDGNFLLEACQEAIADELTVNAGWCLGYLAGFLHTQEIVVFGDTPRFTCIPTEVLVGQLSHVVVKYLTENPENLDWPAGILIWNASVEAYPCEEG